MSSIKLESNASGTGVFTIASPNSNTNRTLTLPDNTGTILTSATTTGFPAGSVLQVVSATYSTSTSTTSTTSYVDTGLSGSITPSSVSSKVLVIVSHPDLRKGDNNGIDMILLRGATQISNFLIYGLYTATTLNLHAGATIAYLDSPNTTSSTTYKTQFKNSGGTTGTIYAQSDNTMSTITLMEIAA